MVEIDLELCKMLITDVFDPERDIESFIVQELEKFSKTVTDEPTIQQYLNEEKPANEQDPATMNDDKMIENEDQIDNNIMKKSQSQPLPTDGDQEPKQKYLTAEK